MLKIAMVLALMFGSPATRPPNFPAPLEVAVNAAERNRIDLLAYHVLAKKDLRTIKTMVENPATAPATLAAALEYFEKQDKKLCGTATSLSQSVQKATTLYWQLQYKLTTQQKARYLRWENKAINQLLEALELEQNDMAVLEKAYELSRPGQPRSPYRSRDIRRIALNPPSR